jgi:membrane protein DedA with SNARE-associated domain/membrane-associated phospholipid phosphatase
MTNFSDYFSVQLLTDFFYAHPYGAGVFTYLIVLLETIAFVGVVFPGFIVMPVIGFLIGTNVIPGGSTFLYAIAGAITGDYISYFMGIYFNKRIHRIWPFTRWPGLLEKGEKFFHVHGGKSIFIGRFVAVVRTVIPMIAGMMKMPLLRFSVAAIPSAAIWVVSYIIPGVLLGALSLELPKKVAAEFTLWIILIIVGVWLLAWLIRHFFKQICQFIDFYVMKIWKFSKEHKALRWYTKILVDPREPNNHQQLLLLFVAIFTSALFFFTMYQVVTDGFLNNLDKPIYFLLKSLRVQKLDYLAVLITLAGSSIMLLLASSLFLVWLLWKRYYYIASHWFGVMVASSIGIMILKFLFYLPRPGEILYEKYSPSFPSAHAALGFAFYGFLAVIIARESKKRNERIPYIIGAILISLIACSRLYLSAHWLTDVLGGILFGLIVVLFATISYRRRHHKHFSAHKITLAAIIIFTLVWLGDSIYSFRKQVEAYSLISPEYVVSFDQVAKVAPLYRFNRLGNVIEALNIRWVGNIEVIKKILLEQGWKLQPVKIDLPNIVEGFFDVTISYHVPVFPQLYHNRPPVLLLTKKMDQAGAILVLHLWSADIDLNDINLPLWLGSIKYYQPNAKVFSLDRFKHKTVFVGATDAFKKYLNNFHWQQKNYLPKQQPTEMADLHWDGKLLIIR